MKVELLIDKKEFQSYSKANDPIILFTAFDRQDNNKFMSDMTRVIRKLDASGGKITPKRIAISSGYSIKEVEMNLYEIEQIMNTLGVY